MTLIQLFLLFSSWNQPPGLASNRRLVAGEMEARYTVFLFFLECYSLLSLPERWHSLWEFMRSKPSSPLLSLVQCLIVIIIIKRKHLWWPLIASWKESLTCSPVTDGVLHLNYGHVTEGISEKKQKQTGTRGFSPCCCIGYGWVLFNLFWDLKRKKKKR